MIRKRMAAGDDRKIYRLVIEQLVPFSRQYQSGTSITFSEIRKRLNHNKTFVAAQGNKEPYGFISILRKSDVLFVDMLAVDPRAQGRGWGKELMKAAEAYGRSERCRTAELFVDDSNPKAIGFYLSKGYDLQEYLPELSCYRMRKQIR
ncbi:GNAT family N-acetyltransferase [Paenibacillus sp. GCM10023248]|uniref:GNAT family N-acetyltransferase n=1 Tax=Bacillales TaxID=1385 RepID=UPI0023790B79|nr:MULTISPECIES: GNAT family N-acetyltransferase [Bacillales]MDD9271171.1 GNAT family N-acetyltransferase [Paenibacillus sp. MAHUQ-63]MDR6881712.1 ribosomal protein S18 acetylase RimI-like enzyme [Bacillus sp. 3255]